ncbi:hypothetical protein KXR87_13635 [Yokenella regensburgei]|uniref:HofO family protein n=1 Tax=Yokenella regensburgei TaxID=158877 RepID=UPI003F174F36
MPRDVESWYGLAPWLRGFCGVMLLTLCLMCCWFGILRPAEAEQQALDGKRVTQQHALRHRWRTLMELKPPAGDAVPTTAVREAFSPLSFHSAGRQLLSWEPTPTGGEMLLETRWSAVPQTFLQLSEENMLAKGFSLALKENVLHFALQLERNNGR